MKCNHLYELSFARQRIPFQFNSIPLQWFVVVMLNGRCFPVDFFGWQKKHSVYIGYNSCKRNRFSTKKNTTRKNINCRKKMKNEDKWRMNKMGLLQSQWMLQYNCFTDKINIYALSNVGGCYYDAVAIAITASNNAAFVLLLLPAPGCYATISKMKETKWNKRILQKYFIVEWKWKLSILEFSFEEKLYKAHKSGDTRIDKSCV